MEDFEHYGVAVVITNLKKDLFYLQKKDEKCPIISFRHKYCFFGGAIETDEKEIFALRRELLEELDPVSAKLIYESSKKLFDDYFINIFHQRTKFSIYESIIDDDELKMMACLPVEEGSGVLVHRKHIGEKYFVSDLRKTSLKYFNRLLECI